MKTIARLLYFTAVYTGLFIAQKLQAAPDQSLAPYLVIQSHDDRQGDAMPLKKTLATARIDGVIAHVSIEQTYANTGHQTLHAEYVFPGSTHAAVHGMSMKIGDRITRAVIREKKQAQQEFAEAKAKQQSASLLEQKRPNVFQTSIANIAPGDEVTITLEYSETIVPEKGMYQWVFPTVVGPRFTHAATESPQAEETWSANPHLDASTPSDATFSLDMSLHSAMKLAEIQCTSHPIKVDWKSAQEATLALHSAAEHANRDVIIEWRLAKDRIDSGMLLHQSDKEKTFLVQIEPPARSSKDDITPREYLFVVDVSGSMAGFPLDTTREMMQNLLVSIRQTDTFNIQLFAGASNTLYDSSLPATSENIEKAMEWMKRTSAAGSTELVSALRQAMAMPTEENRSRSLVLITDGYINFETEAFDLVRENLHKNNVFAFGIGASVNRHLIEGIAHCGEGEPFIVTTPSEAKAMVQRFISYVSSPILTHITLTAEDNELFDVEPVSIRDLFAERPIAVLGKVRHAHSGALVLRGTLADGSIYEKKISLADANMEQGQKSALPALWARERVRRLGDYQSLLASARVAGVDVKNTVEEITNLGLRYSLLTPYTSFVAIDETPRQLTGPAKDVRQALPMPMNVSNSAVGGTVAQSSVPEPGTASMLILILSLLALQRKRE